MYVILKGRVVLSNTHSFYKDISRILSTLKDGEEFGSVAIIEQDRNAPKDDTDSEQKNKR